MYIEVAIKNPCSLCDGSGGHQDYDDWFTCWNCENGQSEEIIMGFNYNGSQENLKDIIQKAIIKTFPGFKFNLNK